MTEHLMRMQIRLGTIAVPVLDLATAATDARTIRYCYPDFQRSAARVDQVLERTNAAIGADSPNWLARLNVAVNFKGLTVGDVHDWVVAVKQTLGAAGDLHDLFISDDINDTPVVWKWKYPDCRLESVRAAPSSIGLTTVNLVFTAGGEPVEDPV